MTVITFFNRHNPNLRYAPGAFESMTGKEVPIFRETEGGKELLGMGTVMGVSVDEEGILITYETSADLAMFLELPISPVSVVRPFDVT